MDGDYYSEKNDMHERAGPEEGMLVAEIVPEELTAEMLGAPPRPRRVWLPLALFLATCWSTWYAGQEGYRADGWMYAAAVMTILVCHEAGHFLQARRYGVHTSFPYFIPMPITPFGTAGAVIGMSSQIKDRRALYDIGITGPLAGLVPTIFFCIVGLSLSRHAFLSEAMRSRVPSFGEPLLFQAMVRWLLGPLPPGHEVIAHPLAFAGLVGMFITALNLIPIGQLDGGHVLYAILRRKAHAVAMILLTAAVVVVVWHIHAFGGWLLMIFLLAAMGPRHPPTADDHVPLGTARIILGWLTLAFLFIGFTPTPIVVN